MLSLAQMFREYAPQRRVLCVGYQSCIERCEALLLSDVAVLAHTVIL